MTGACGFPAPVKPAKLIILLKRIFHNQPPFPKNKESNDPQKRKATKPERNSIQNGCPNKRWGNVFRKTSVAKLFSSTGKAQQKSVRLRPKMKIGRPTGHHRALPSGLPLGLMPQTPRCFASLPRLRAGRGILVLCCQLLLCRYARHKDSGHIGILLRNFKGWFLFFGLLQTAHCKDRRKINGRTTPSIFRRTLPLFPAHSPTYSGSATSAHAIHYEDEKQIYPPTAYWH